MAWTSRARRCACSQPIAWRTCEGRASVDRRESSRATTSGALVGLFVVGLTTAPLFPLCSAQAYAQLPGRATLVTAAGEIFVVFDVAMPWLMGIAADAFGLVIALAFVAVGPAVILVVVLRSTWRE